MLGIFWGCFQGSPVCDALLVSGVVLLCVRGKMAVLLLCILIFLLPKRKTQKSGKKTHTENHQLFPFCHDSCTLKRLQRVLKNFLISAAAASSPGAAVSHLSERKM